jgi:hypothetical protein
MRYETYTQEEPSLGELLSTLSNQAGLLIRQELELAQAEMTRKVTRAGRNVAFIAIGGVLAQAALLAVVAALILVLSEVMSPWLAALIVSVLLAIVAGLLVRYGLNKLKEIDPTPRRTVETMRENKEWLSQQV